MAGAKVQAGLPGRHRPGHHQHGGGLCRSGRAQAGIQLFDIEQLLAPGEVGAAPPAAIAALPSRPGRAGRRRSAAAVATARRDRASNIRSWAPWRASSGAQVPGRLVSSAKSWLSHANVDRQAPILPWGAEADVAKVSPVAASASYLAYVRAAWNHRFPEHPLENQELVLTIPASFDEGARALDAGRRAPGGPAHATPGGRTAGRLL